MTSTAPNHFTAARTTPNDEFYTQLVDIEKELAHYPGAFRDKTVYLPCDDPRDSAFWTYFEGRFHDLGLRRLIATAYAGGPRGEAVVCDWDGEGEPKVTRLEDDGDFRGTTARALLEQADVVVTNPPFSLFREFVAQLVEAGKEFLVLGTLNAVTYADVWPVIQGGQVWLGVSRHNLYLEVPEAYPATATRFKVDPDGTRLRSLGNARWFTNLEHKQRHQKLTLSASFSPDVYPQYDNYGAIEVSRIADIPTDYDGAMGVPITYLDHHDPDRFELLGLSGGSTLRTKYYRPRARYVDGVAEVSLSGALGCAIRTDNFGPGPHFDVGYPVRSVYRRVFIRRR